MIRLTKGEFAEYKKLGLREKLTYIRARVSVSSKGFRERVIRKPILAMPIFVAITIIATMGYISLMANLLGLKNMNEYYHCNNCGSYSRSDHMTRYTYLHSELGSDVYEEEYCCPICGVDDFEKANVCSICETPTMNSVVCDDCKKLVVVVVKELVEKVKTELQGVDESDIKDLLVEIIDEV